MERPRVRRSRAPPHRPPRASPRNGRVRGVRDLEKERARVRRDGAPLGVVRRGRVSRRVRTVAALNIEGARGSSRGARSLEQRKRVLAALLRERRRRGQKRGGVGQSAGDVRRPRVAVDASEGKVEDGRLAVRGETVSHTTPFAWCTPFLQDLTFPVVTLHSRFPFNVTFDR